MFQGRPALRAFANMCVWPDCEKNTIEEIDSPLCERHLTKAFRIYRTSHLWVLADGIGPGAHLPPRPEANVGGDGFVYFVRFRDRIKIGFATNVKQRLDAIPHEEVLRIVPGTMADERQCHAAFAHLREIGEWFRIEPDLLAFIDDIASWRNPTHV